MTQTTTAKFYLGILCGIAAMGGIVACSESVARIANGVLLYVHGMTLIAIAGLAVTWLFTSRDHRDPNGYKSLLFFFLFVAGAAAGSWRVASFPDWDTQFAVSANALSGFALAIDLVFFYQLIRRRPSVTRYNALMASERYQEALEILQPELNRKNPEALYLIPAASIHLQLGETEEGCRLLDQGLARMPRDAIALANVAWMCHVFNLYGRGQPLIDEAIAKDGQHHVVLLVYCRYLISSARFDEAREVWSRIQDTDDPAAIAFLKDAKFQKLISTLNESDTPKF